MALISVWVGATTASTAWIRAKVDPADTVRIGVRPQTSDPELPGPFTFQSAGDPTAEGMVSVRLTELTADTRYEYQVEVDGVLDTDYPGKLVTHPTVGESASFSFGVMSCAGLDPLTPGVTGSLVPDRISNDDVFALLADVGSVNWLGLAHIGDMAYYNIGGNVAETVDPSLDNYRRQWDDVLLQPNQHRLYREVPLWYVWDDHDYGPNNSGGDAPGRLLAQQVYREKVPHYNLPAEEETDGNRPIYQSVTIGRVLLIVSDTRSSKYNSTFLGWQQKQWMRSVLESSDAEFLVWLTPTPWLRNHGAWQYYPDEQDELVDMFTTTGWVDRMIAVGGDFHHMGISDGGIAPGGVPSFVFSGLDSGGNDGSHIAYEIGSTNDQASNTVRGLYGVIDVTDTGDEITVTGSGYTNGAFWNSYSVTVTPTGGDDGGGGSAPRPDVAEAAPRQEVTWLACDLLSGRIITELPDITGSVKRVLGAHTSASFSLPIPQSGPASLGERALQATAPGRTMIVPVVNDVPSAGYIVLKRKGGSGATLELGCVSLEGYLARRYVPSMNFPDADEAEIARQLVETTNRLRGVGTFVGIGYEIDAPNTGTRRERHYEDSDDATVYRRLRELMGVEGGPEWTVDVDWEDSTQRAVAKIFRLRKRIGRDRPNAVFDSRGPSEATYSYTEDYSDGRGANLIVATGSGEGEDRPEGDSTEATDEPPPPPGWPLYEQRISPSNSIKSEDVLRKHAEAELALVQFGSKTFELQTRWDATPRLNIDWALGDTLHWDVVGHRHPEGLRGSGRVIGWSLDMSAGTVEPILLDRQEGLV